MELEEPAPPKLTSTYTAVTPSMEELGYGMVPPLPLIQVSSDNHRFCSTQALPDFRASTESLISDDDLDSDEESLDALEEDEESVSGHHQYVPSALSPKRKGPIRRCVSMFDEPRSSHKGRKSRSGSLSHIGNGSFNLGGLDLNDSSSSLLGGSRSSLMSSTSSKKSNKELLEKGFVFVTGSRIRRIDSAAQLLT